MATYAAWSNHVPKQARAPRTASMMQSAPAGQVPQRKLTLSPDSPPTSVNILDANGEDIATLPHGQRNATFRGRGDIGAIVFTVDGIARRCDLAGLDWLDNTTHIGMHTSTRYREPTCTLEDLTETVATPDIAAQLQGNRCVYMSDQRGQSGMVCE
jgi:hypothetical protein